MPKHFLLVCEGQTDYFVIQSIANVISKKLNDEIKITLLAPQKDATTNNYQRHGWTEIRNWCRLYGNKTAAQLAALPPAVRHRAQRLNWQALIAFNNADGLIIQLDTDIAEEIRDIAPFDPAIIHRRDYCDGALLAWLGEAARPGDIYLALTSYALEAWLLSTYSRKDPVFSDLPVGFDFEEIHDLESRLIKLKCPSVSATNGRRKLAKKERYYHIHAKTIANNLGVVRANCQSAEDLCAHLETP